VFRASGVVYIGRDNVTDEVVAVKQVNLDEQPQLSVIVRELEAMSLLTHTNVIEYKASYLVNRTLWIVMEYLDGKHLQF